MDIFIDLDGVTKANLTEVEKALMKMVGLIEDSLISGKEFMVCLQVQGEIIIECFAEELLRLFSQAYLTEAPTFNILLQHFLTGILLSIGQQLLLCGKLTTLKKAIKDTSDIEY